MNDYELDSDFEIEFDPNNILDGSYLINVFDSRNHDNQRLFNNSQNYDNQRLFNEPDHDPSEYDFDSDGFDLEYEPSFEELLEIHRDSRPAKVGVRPVNVTDYILKKSCPICLNTFQEGSNIDNCHDPFEIVELHPIYSDNTRSKRHLYHGCCVHQWLTTSNSCPECRSHSKFGQH